MANDELINVFLQALRQQEKTFREVVREEVNSAVYASEQRINERMDERFNKVEARLDKMEGRLDKLEETQGQILAEMVVLKADQQQFITVLNEATLVINDIRSRQDVLELKVEENLRGFARTIQKMGEITRSALRDCLELISQVNHRIAEHERTPIDQAHPGSASVA
jgi:glutathionyl-hydroquinone reductase